MAVDVMPLVRVGVLELGRRRAVCLPRCGLARRLRLEPRPCGAVARAVARWERRRGAAPRRVSSYSKALGFAKSLTRPGRS
jgi:hypothetical protein